MPHAQRKKSETGFYHVVSKGDGGQIIFEDDADREYYLDVFEDSLKQHEIKAHAYCLMDNHVHLLLQDELDGLSGFMKRLNETYAMYFCKKTERTGHVFQGRFWCEPVDTERYLLAALRYVHANPEPAGICRAKDYPWSSYHEYIGNSRLTTTSLVLELLCGKEGFESLHERGGAFAKPFPKSAFTRHLSYDELMRVAVNLLGRDTLNTLKTMGPKERRPHLEAMKEAGFTDTQIARLTGIGQSSVNRALNA